MNKLKTVRWIILCVLTFALVTFWVPAALAQISLPSLEQATPSNNLSNGVKQVGEVEVAIIRLNGTPLLEVVETTHGSRNQKEGQVPVESRAQQLENNLKRVVEPDPNLKRRQENHAVTNFDPKSFRILLSTLHGETVLLAHDRYHVQPLRLLNVTQPDAEYYGVNIQDLAQEWQQLLETNLKQELEERQPKALGSQAVKSALIVTLSGLFSVAIWFIQRFLVSRHQILRSRQIEQPNHPETFPDVSEHDQQPQVLSTLHYLFGLEQRLTINGFLQWLLTWVHAILWILTAVYICWNFPSTRQYTQYVLGVPIALLFIWFSTGFVNRMGDILVNRLMKNWGEDALFASGNSQRRSLRLSTTFQALKGLKTFLVYGVGIGLALSILGVQVTSLLAGGAVIAFALSFGFQNLMRDLVMGCLILWEDQFAIGDHIAVGTATGLVENMNLRMTQLRNSEGCLITLPNSSISQVKNLTRLWSRVDFSIEVAYETDIQEALSVLREVGQQLYDDLKYRDRICEPPEVLGIENISQTGIVLRMFIKTQPLHQWIVARALRLRVKLAFDDHHICVGTPQKVFWSADESVSVNGSSGKIDTTSEITEKNKVCEQKSSLKRKYLNSQNKQDKIASR
jgi:moderate conductance mechanosensitive channel